MSVNTDRSTCGEHLCDSDVLYQEELDLLLANPAGHHMPHNLSGCHESFADKILLLLTAFSSICALSLSADLYHSLYL